MKERVQTTDTVVMVRPDHFGFNSETATTNAFQHAPQDNNSYQIQQKALEEFHAMVSVLRKHDISVIVLPSPRAITPDAVFPNNWFSHHSDGSLILYPMFAPNRRKERQPGALITALQKKNINHIKIIDYTYLETLGEILESTGSLVLDRIRKVVFGVLSSRTSKSAFERWCRDMGYEGLPFSAFDNHHRPIYHTNVVMSVGEKFAVVCLDAIANRAEKMKVREKLMNLGKEIIPISLDQMILFGGNIIQLTNTKGESKIIISKRAFTFYSRGQKKKLEQFGEIVEVDIPTIETVGGGSVRCMLAEVFH